METFIIASNNQHKIKEIDRILNPLGIKAVSAKDIGICLDDVEETGTTFMENAIIKAEAAYKKTGMAAVADDSGLTVDALDGRPGIFSARYGGEGKNDIDRYNIILEEMKDVPDEKRTAAFVSSICCILKNGEKVFAEGKCYGKIGYEPKGEDGFGYDPIFITESGKSFAELTPKEKDSISHRGNALSILEAKLSKIMEGIK